MSCTLHSSPSKPLSHLERALPRGRNTLCFLPGTAIQRCYSVFLKEPPCYQDTARADEVVIFLSSSSVVGWRNTKNPRHNRNPTFATFSHNYYSTTRKHGGRTRTDYLCECSWGPRRSSAVLFHVSTQTQQTQPLPRPCMLYHSQLWPDMYDTHRPADSGDSL